MLRIINCIRIVFDILVSVGRIFRYQTFKGGLKYSNQSVNEILYVLATGPSLKVDLQENIELFSKSKSLVVNDFVLDESYSAIKPSYYVFADPGYWLDEDLTTSDNISIRDEVFTLIINKTFWRIDIYVPKVAISFFQLVFKENPHVLIKTYNNIDLGGMNNHWGRFCLKFNLLSPCVNVAATSIYLGINLGFKVINLYGTDHSWTKDLRVDDANRVCMVSKHFYDQGDSCNFVPWLKVNEENYKMHEILTDLSKTFYDYFVLNDYAKSKGVKVYNQTKDSFIDAFPRIQ